MQSKKNEIKNKNQKNPTGSSSISLGAFGVVATRSLCDTSPRTPKNGCEKKRVREKKKEN